jgi:predicted DNA-binding transcriptional regulator YafY
MVSEWQPIETCPENETVLVYCEAWDEERDPVRQCVISRMAGERLWDFTGGFDHWFDRDLMEDGENGIPTHWMPMPAPPSESSK